MGKIAQSTTKYLIEADFIAEGLVEKPDVIGAVFGQTEGLLGQDLDLRELQKSGRIGRIDVELREKDGKTEGTIYIPSSLDSSETALIAAAIETIERIGPCEAKITLRDVKDIREVKREYVVDRAKEILQKLMKEQPDADALAEAIKGSVRTSEIIEHNGIECGPDAVNAEEVILVEGRADVINLLKAGIKNVAAIGGTASTRKLEEFTRNKKVTAFLDGDRGGDLVLKKLSRFVKVDYVARAPDGKEVEELADKEIFICLKQKLPFVEAIKKKYSIKKPRKHETMEEHQEYKENKEFLTPERKQKIIDILDKMVGTRAAYVFNEKMKMVDKLPLTQFTAENKSLENAKIVLIDGTITKEIAEEANKAGVEYLIASSAEKKFTMEKTKILTSEDLTNNF
ncbi:MAG: DNA primase [Candidatus Aenigmarchaeota archaeon]|nr:DNA primase [Candidatus Aenigmarchaeota archaeon]MBU5689167.1 DNA primase [Candidatus Aenigmarchaeota archaeon]